MTNVQIIVKTSLGEFAATHQGASDDWMRAFSRASNQARRAKLRHMTDEYGPYFDETGSLVMFGLA